MKSDDEIIAFVTKEPIEKIRENDNSPEPTLVLTLDEAFECMEYVHIMEEAKYMAESIKNQVPYRCPICGGTGIVPGGFYTSIYGSAITSGNMSEPCRQCGGFGVIWR